MKLFTAILTDLRAAIAARAARDRALTVLLCAVWARVGRMAQRMERLFLRWKAGTLPKPRAPRPTQEREAGDRVPTRPRFPSAPGWLFARVWEAGAFGSQLAHMVQDTEFAAFVAEVPAAGRILRPLFRMLTFDPVPEMARPRPAVVYLRAAEAIKPCSLGILPVSHFLDV